MNYLISLAFDTTIWVDSCKAYGLCRLMKTLQELLEYVAADLNPTIDYIAQLRSGGYRTINGVKQADNAEQIQQACGLLLGDANIIWKAAGEFAGKQLNFCGL